MGAKLKHTPVAAVILVLMRASMLVILLGLSIAQDITRHLLFGVGIPFNCFFFMWQSDEFLALDRLNARQGVHTVEEAQVGPSITPIYIDIIVVEEVHYHTPKPVATI